MNKKIIEEFMKTDGKDAFFNFIEEASKGNPGAAMFTLELMRRNPKNSWGAIQRMIAIGITGDKLYMLWNDCCDCNFDKALNVMLNNSTEDIMNHINYKEGRGIKY